MQRRSFLTKTALGAKPGTVRISSARDGADVKLSVSDTGKGIDPSIRDRIFEPFFTTKDVWTNLGVGLSESFRIVEDHKGRFVVDSEVGKGTTRTGVLPHAELARSRALERARAGRVRLVPQAGGARRGPRLRGRRRERSVRGARAKVRVRSDSVRRPGSQSQSGDPS